MKRINYYIMMFVMAVIAIPCLTSCDEEDDYLAQQLRDKDWQGYIGTYYSYRWGISGDDYRTVMHFSSKESWYTSGRGEELDYRVGSRNDYAYCTFKWFIVDGVITLIYDDDKWSPYYIRNYTLNSTRFRGRLDDGSDRKIEFDLENENYSDWDYYDDRTGGYGDFSHQRNFYSRTAPTFDEDAPLFLNRSEEAKQHSGEADAVSIASGIFAEKIMNK